MAKKIDFTGFPYRPYDVNKDRVVTNHELLGDLQAQVSMFLESLRDGSSTGYFIPEVELAVINDVMAGQKGFPIKYLSHIPDKEEASLLTSAIQSKYQGEDDKMSAFLRDAKSREGKYYELPTYGGTYKDKLSPSSALLHTEIPTSFGMKGRAAEGKLNEEDQKMLPECKLPVDVPKPNVMNYVHNSLQLTKDLENLTKPAGFLNSNMNQNINNASIAINN